MKPNYPGNTIQEYSFIIGLVTLASLGGLIAFGSNLNGLFHHVAQQGANGSIMSMLSPQAPANGGSKTSPSGGASAKPVSQPASNGQVCLSNGQCATISVSAYSPAQVAGANGIDIVDTYADTINKLASMAHSDPNVNPDFAAMLDDLAADGHNVAGDERSVLTWSAAEGGMSFDIENRYATTKARAMDFLAAHPDQLTPEVAQILHTAADNITAQASDFAGGSSITSLNADNINKKFTDAGGSKGATYVDGQASTVCSSGGQNCH